MNVQLNPLEEIGLVALREMRNTFRSVKGLALALLTVGGGGGIMALILPKARAFEDRYASMPPEVMTTLREQAIDLYSRDPAAPKALGAAPSGILILTILTLSLTPAFLALIGFDVVSADLQHRAVRYWTVRVRRASYLLGKFFGLWATAMVVVFLLHLLVWGMMVYRGDATASAAFGWGARLFAAWIPIAASWAAVDVLVGQAIGRPFLSLIAIFVLIFVLWAISKAAPFLHVNPLVYVWPNEYLSMIADGDATSTGQGLALAVAFVVSALGGSVVLFSRRDV